MPTFTKSKKTPNIIIQEEEDPLADIEIRKLDKHQIKFKDGTSTNVYQINTKDKKTYLDYEDVELVASELKSKFPNKRIQVRGLAEKWKVLKPYDRDVIKEQDFDDYFKGKVEDTTKFKKFSQLLIFIGG